MGGQRDPVINEGGRRLIYAPKFRNLVRGNPGLIDTFRKSRLEGRDLRARSVSVERLDVDGNNHVGAWRLGCGRIRLFAKESVRDEGHKSVRKGGLDEMECLLQLRQIATGRIVPAEPLAAFSEGRTSFIITFYYDLPKFAEANPPDSFWDSLGAFSAIARMMSITDVDAENALYSKNTGRIIVIDPVRIAAGPDRAADWPLAPPSFKLD